MRFTNIFLTETQNGVTVSVSYEGDVIHQELVKGKLREALMVALEYIYINKLDRFIIHSTDLKFIDTYKERGYNLRFGQEGDYHY